ncbi:MAG: hypothetical protein ACRC6V_00565 [Bacteroidales bacterium]
MIKCEQSSTTEMSEYKEALDIVKTLLHSGLTVEGWLKYLEENEEVWKVVMGDKVLGFYTLSLEPLFGEGHAYIFPSYRRFSSRFLKLMIEHVLSTGRFPKTTATSDFPHVVRFLKMLGFTEVGVEKGGMVKDHGLVDVTYFLYLNL